MNLHVTKSDIHLRLEKALHDIEQSDVAFDLHAHAKKYPHASAPMPELERWINRTIADYDPKGGYGKKYLLGHLARTSRALCESLKQSGYDAGAARTLEADFCFHDAGKTEQPIEYWPHTKLKPFIPEHIKGLRPEHTTKILDVVTNGLAETGVIPNEDEFQRLVRICYMGKYHHENKLGTGPHVLPAHKIDDVLARAITIDTADGKLKAKQEHDIIIENVHSDAIEKERIIRVIFSEMADGKLKDHFDPALLGQQEKLYLNNPGLLFSQ